MGVPLPTCCSTATVVTVVTVVVVPEEEIITHCAAISQYPITDKLHNKNNTNLTKEYPPTCLTHQITTAAKFTSMLCELQITLHNYQSNYQSKLNPMTPMTQILNNSSNNTQIPRTTTAIDEEEYLSAIQQPDRLYTKIDGTQNTRTHTKCKHNFAYLVHCVLILAAAEPDRGNFFHSLASLAITRKEIKADDTKAKKTDPRNRTEDHNFTYLVHCVLIFAATEPDRGNFLHSLASLATTRTEITADDTKAKRTDPRNRTEDHVITDRELSRCKRECKANRPGAGKASFRMETGPYKYQLQMRYSASRCPHTHHTRPREQARTGAGRPSRPVGNEPVNLIASKVTGNRNTLNAWIENNAHNKQPITAQSSKVRCKVLKSTYKTNCRLPARTSRRHMHLQHDQRLHPVASSPRH